MKLFVMLGILNTCVVDNEIVCNAGLYLYFTLSKCN